VALGVVLSAFLDGVFTNDVILAYELIELNRGFGMVHVPMAGVLSEVAGSRLHLAVDARVNHLNACTFSPVSHSVSSDRGSG